MDLKKEERRAAEAGRRVVFVPSLTEVRAAIPLRQRFGWSACPVPNIIAPWHKMGEVLFVADENREEVERWIGN